jgi:flavin reductase (DIM6/NTAB) family NADH-FMN oxidoreductase RutF
VKKSIPSESYHLLHPKMTFLLTSITKDGKPNVMTCAWATPVSDEPPIVIVCVSKGHYTTKLIKQTKEFVINIPARKLLKALWICGRVSGKDTDKFKKAKLDTVSLYRKKDSRQAGMTNVRNIIKQQSFDNFLYRCQKELT